MLTHTWYCNDLINDLDLFHFLRAIFNAGTFILDTNVEVSVGVGVAFDSGIKSIPVFKYNAEFLNRVPSFGSKPLHHTYLLCGRS